MVNGEYHEGLLLESNDQFITIENSNGKFKLLSKKVKKIKANDYLGMYQYANRHDTRYFIAPSAIPLEKGKGIYSNFFLIGNAVNYGISDNISIGVATELVNTLVSFYPLWSLNAKAGFWVSDNIHLGGGFSLTNQSALIETFSGEKNELIAFLPYSVITLGHSESSVSLGFSYNVSKNFDPFLGFDSFNWDKIDQRGPILSISGTQRLSNKASVMSEHNFGYLAGEFKYVGIHGMQAHYKRNNCRLGLLFIGNFSSLPLLAPFLGYAIMF